MTLSELFETFTRSAFRLEGLPHYSVPEEDAAYTHFLTTGEINPESNEEWGELVEKNVAAEKTMQRLRLFGDPLSRYEEFEILGYEQGISHGEEIRMMDRDDWPWTGDFWFFDEKYIARMHYDADGAFVGVDIEEATEDDIEDLTYWMDIFRSAPLLRQIYPAK